MKLSALFSSASLAALILASAATAQVQDREQADDQAASSDVIVVTGIRSALANARDIRRNADVIQDTILAEDMADFPDLNLAEALQRLPGVAINREAGEGRRISLRGLGPDFTRVQLNGMEVLGNVDSPQDSRGQRSRDRAFDFNIFASELFNRVDVRKSYSAEQNEGGMAGTVGLYTAKPFDYDGFRVAGSVRAGTNTQTEDFQPRIAGLISNTWEDANGGEFGALLSVAWSQRQTQEQGTNTYRWRQRTNDGSTYGPTLGQAEIDRIESGELHFPRGNRLSSWGADQERLGVTGALQWRPTPGIELTLDVLYGRFENDREENNLSSRGSSSTWLGGGATVDGVSFPNSVINDIEWNAADEVVYLDVSGANITSETRRQRAENEFRQIALSGEWDVTDRLFVTGLVGYEESTYELPRSDKFYMESFVDVTSDYRQDRFHLQNTYGADLTDPSIWRAHEIDLETVSQTSRYESAQFEAAYTLSDAFTVKTGASYRAFSNDGERAAANNILQGEWQSGAVDDAVAGYTHVFEGHPDQNWLIVDHRAAFDGYGVDREAILAAQPNSDSFEITEDTYAAFAQLDWEGSLFGRPAFGNAGARYVYTEVMSEGVVNGQSEVVTSDYDDILPAANLAVEAAPDFIVRAAASRNINRPSLTALNASGSVGDQGSGGNIEIVASAGNPSLAPFESVNLDLSFEKYFGDVGLISIGFFYKDISGIIGTDTGTDITYGQTGLSLGLLQAVLESAGVPGQTASADYPVARFSRPVNYAGTEITGVEIAAQSDLFFLPGAFANFGVFGNVTFTEAELDYASPEQVRAGESYVYPLTGVSDTLANASVYYETERYGARVSMNYRSDWLSSVSPNGGDEDRNGYNETTYVDFSAFYQISDSIKWTFDAINLTDVREEQYSDSARRLYNATESGTTVYTGVNFQF